MKLVCSMIWEAKAIDKTNKKAGKVCDGTGLKWMSDKVQDKAGDKVEEVLLSPALSSWGGEGARCAILGSKSNPEKLEE